MIGPTYYSVQYRSVHARVQHNLVTLKRIPGENYFTRHKDQTEKKGVSVPLYKGYGQLPRQLLLICRPDNGTYVRTNNSVTTEHYAVQYSVVKYRYVVQWLRE